MNKTILTSFLVLMTYVGNSYAQSACEKADICVRGLSPMCSHLSYMQCNAFRFDQERFMICSNQINQQAGCTSCDVDKNACQAEKDAAATAKIKHDQDCQNNLIENFIWHKNACISKEQYQNDIITSCKNTMWSFLVDERINGCEINATTCIRSACGDNDEIIVSTLKSCIPDLKSQIEGRKQDITYARKQIVLERSNPSGVVSLARLHDLGVDIQDHQRVVKFFESRIVWIQKQLKSFTKK